MEHPAVAEVAVIGKPDPQRTEIVKAVIVLKSGVEGTGRPEVGNPADGAPAPFDACLSARDRLHRSAAEDAERQDPAFHSTRRVLSAGKSLLIFRNCQAPKSKIFRFTILEIRIITSLSRADRGAYHDRHFTLAAGCGGRGASGARGIAGRDEPRERFSRATRRMTLAGRVAYGEAVWSWRPLLALNWRRRCGVQPGGQGLNSQMTVTRRIRRRGERGVSRKAIAQGMSECLRSPVCSCAPNAHFCTRDRGCSVHPAFPAPSPGRKRFARLGQIVPRECMVVFAIGCLKFAAEPQGGQGVSVPTIEIATGIDGGHGARAPLPTLL